MNLLLSMLPFYVLGNIHCMGMCGPIAMILSRHPHRYLYFWGRILSFTIAAWLAAEVGSVLNQVLQHHHISSFISCGFGVAMCALAVAQLRSWHLPTPKFLRAITAQITQTFALWIQRKAAFPVFLMGFFTVVLPCGQTLIVFSACAVQGEPMAGVMNGLAFALLTTPSLWLAMGAQRFFARFRHWQKAAMGLSLGVAGIFSVCRGLAQAELIPHLVLSERLHLVIY